ncbi:MAG: acylneuraminate cytidylyltransferase family protein [Crocinitomicaceae bacterium]|nr:acylneuraminate cytidylyltransferase family protein [Crocinitomicaceae bacterium]
MKRNILITICARGGSKGVPNKNIHDINGKPLIGYTIESAFKIAAKIDADVFLSTDSEVIQQIASDFALESDYLRPADLASDASGKIDVLYDAIRHNEQKNNIQYDYLIDLDVSSPLRSVQDVVSAMEKLESNSDALNIFSVSEARKNPYFNMVEKNKDGFYSLSKDGRTFYTRQSAHEVFELNASFYIYKKRFFEQKCTSAITNKSLVYKMDHICFDIDNEIEMHFLEYLLKENKLNFEL